MIADTVTGNPGQAGSGDFSLPDVGRLLANGNADPAFAAHFFTNGHAGPAAIQPDGKIVVAVSLCPTASPCFSSTPAVFRLNSDGTFDSGFGSGGSTRLNVADSLGGIAIQADGKIVVSTPGKVVRLLATGQMDPTYGQSGIASFTIPGATGLRAPALLVLQGDGRAVVATTADMTQQGATQVRYMIAAVRLDTSGALDPTFNGDGTRLIDLGSVNTNDQADAVAIQPDGRILVSGSIEGGTRGAITRLLSNGAFDPQFAMGGFLKTSLAIPIADLALQSTGRIVAVGGQRIIRLTQDGWPDATFRGASPPYQHLHVVAFGSSSARIVDAGTGGSPVTGSMTFHQYDGGTQLDIFSDSGNFASVQYRDFLGREGDDSGIGYWSGQIDSGSMSRAQVAESFFNSDEFQKSVAPVVRLYVAYFLRYPDLAGLNFWIDYSKSGNSLETLSNIFAYSAEFQSRYGSLDNGQFVSLVYRNVLARDPAPDERAYWVNQLNGGTTRGQMMISFSESLEFASLSHNEVYVTMIYSAMLRRTPDPDGFRFWLGYMDQGNPGLNLINAVVQSDEYRRRFLP